MEDSYNRWREEEKGRIAALQRSITSQLTPAIDQIKQLALGQSALNFLVEQREQERKAFENAAITLKGPDASLLASSMNSWDAAVVQQLAREHQQLASVSQLVDGIGALVPRYDYESLFRKPAIFEISKLMSDGSAGSQLASSISDVSTTIENRMRSMQHAWAQTNFEIQSASAFIDLQAIGELVGRQTNPFEEHINASLRKALGDWREIVSPFGPILADPLIRTALYADHGFDTRLTDFPEEAFSESLVIAELSEGEDTVHLGTKERDFTRLEELEIELRGFISANMHQTFGEKWLQQQLPANMLDRWLEKKGKAVKARQPECPLIEYADFTDYILIIQKKDNWNHVFEAVFLRVEDIRESLQRLSPLRVARMHARALTKADRLLLYVESRRILQAMRRMETP